MSTLLILCKEHYGIAVGGFGILWWKLYKDYKGLIVAIFGLMIFTLIIFVIMPYLGNGMHPMLNDNLGISRYSWIKNHHWGFLKPLFLSTESESASGYLVILLGFFLYLPIGAIFWFCPASADLLVNILSSNPMPRSILSYHSITIIPCAVIASCVMLNKIKLKAYIKIIALLFIIAASLRSDFIEGPLALHGENIWNVNIWDAHQLSKDKDIDEIKNLIGKDSSVSAQINIGSWFAKRKKIYPFPNIYKGVDYLILNSTYPYAEDVIAFGNPYDPTEYEQITEKIKNDQNYSLIYKKDYWLVYKFVSAK